MSVGGSEMTIKYEPLRETNLLFIMFDDLVQTSGRDKWITPNLDRLAAVSVNFDLAVSQIAVCNPSRASMLTGLRPDSVGTMGFDAGYKPMLVWPTQLARSGFATSSFGKILHFDGPDKEVWNDESAADIFGKFWYGVQATERNFLNSTVAPDKYKKEREYPDYDIASKAIKNLRKHWALRQGNHEHRFLTAVGFKLPHLQLNMPFSSFDLYAKSLDSDWLEEESPEGHRSFPPSAHPMSFRCCAEEDFIYRREDDTKSNDTYFVGSADRDHRSTAGMMQRAFPARAYRELSQGYRAGVTFADRQLGRILNTIDELQLWNNLTIVLSADHGIHNGEKGMWGKWSLFDESTRVPLMIYHPQSPYKGKHYSHPVELIDIYPTVLDLMQPPYDKEEVYNQQGARHRRHFVPLAGQSRLGEVLGPAFRSYSRPSKRQGVTPSNAADYAVSQIYYCSYRELDPMALDPRRPEDEAKILAFYKALSGQQRRKADGWDKRLWWDCDLTISNKTMVERGMPEEVAFMRYSLRSEKYRYTAAVQFHRFFHVPLAYEPPFQAEELYDHSTVHPSKQPHKPVGSAWVGKEELTNLAASASHEDVLEERRSDLVKLMRRTEYKHFLPADGRWKGKGKGKGRGGQRRKGIGGGKGPGKGPGKGGGRRRGARGKEGGGAGHPSARARRAS